MRKPKLVISKCLNSEKCRYDGCGYNDKVISLLKGFVDIKTICPENAIGLPIPRDPIHIEKHNDTYKLIQLNSNIDYTNQMTEFAEEFLNISNDIDGFILKSKSPSCGINDVKIYPQSQKCSIKKNGTGIFSSKVIEKYSNVPIENEGRLKNYNIRHEFFTKIFLINNLKSENNILNFHNKNLLLLKSYSKEITKELSNILNKPNLNNKDINLYKSKVYEILKNKRNKNSNLSIAKDIFEKYKNNLNIDEINYFENLSNLHKEGQIPFSSIMIALHMYVIRFNDKELLNQTFFNPYPESLISASDSGKGKNSYEL